MAAFGGAEEEEWEKKKKKPIVSMGNVGELARAGAGASCFVRLVSVSSSG